MTELDTLLNPGVQVEVLAKSTAAYDQGQKFEHYRTLPSLKEVLFVAQGSVHVIHYHRQSADTWILSETRELEDKVTLASIEAEIPLTEVYAKVRIEKPSGPTAVS